MYRWQAYMIERLEQEIEKLKEDYEFLKGKENKYFKDAVRFERKLYDSNKVFREHLEMCHHSKPFLNEDMTENLVKLRAICEDRSEFVYDHEPTQESHGAGGNAESTLAQRGHDGEVNGEQEGRKDNEMAREHSQSSAGASDWSNVSKPEGSQAD